MSGDADADVRERALGWVRVASLAVGIAAVPAWFLITGIAIQLSPDLNGTSAIVSEGEIVVMPVTWWDWAWMGGAVASWMCFALPFILAAILVGRFAWEAWRLRDKAERARYDAMVASDAVIDDPEWHVDSVADRGAPTEVEPIEPLAPETR